MLAASSGAGTITPRSTTLRGLLARGRSAWADSTSSRFVGVTALGVGLISFLATELMHYLLVPDLGRHHERLLAEGMSAFVLTCVVAKLANIHRLQCRRTAARMQVISEMNHHIRNALTPVSLSVDAIDNQQLTCVISEAVNRIEWALREILPRETPLQENIGKGSGILKQEGANINEQRKSPVR